MKQVLLFLFISTQAFSYEIKKDMISFRYQPNELAGVKCTHQITNPKSGDWTVRCPFFNTIKEFSVHLIARLYKRNYKPQNKYEVLYWVTNRRERQLGPEFTGTTLWFNFEDQTVPHSITMEQHVDNNYASLVLNLSLLK